MTAAVCIRAAIHAGADSHILDQLVGMPLAGGEEVRLPQPFSPEGICGSWVLAPVHDLDTHLLAREQECLTRLLTTPGDTQRHIWSLHDPHAVTSQRWSIVDARLQTRANEALREAIHVLRDTTRQLITSPLTPDSRAQGGVFTNSWWRFLSICIWLTAVDTPSGALLRAVTREGPYDAQLLQHLRHWWEEWAQQSGASAFTSERLQILRAVARVRQGIGDKPRPVPAAMRASTSV